MRAMSTSADGQATETRCRSAGSGSFLSGPADPEGGSVGLGGEWRAWPHPALSRGVIEQACDKPTLRGHVVGWGSRDLCLPQHQHRLPSSRHASRRGARIDSTMRSIPRTALSLPISSSAGTPGLSHCEPLKRSGTGSERGRGRHPPTKNVVACSCWAPMSNGPGQIRAPRPRRASGSSAL